MSAVPHLLAHIVDAHDARPIGVDNHADALGERCRRLGQPLRALGNELTWDCAQGAAVDIGGVIHSGRLARPWLTT